MTNDDIWKNWIRTGYTTSATTTGHQVWTIWNQATAITAASFYETTLDIRESQAYETDRLTHRGRVSPEERARRDAAELLAVADGHKRLEAKKEANRKAELLLRSCLTQQQLDDLDQKKCFYLYSKGRKYRIDRGQHGNVKLLGEQDRVLESYCIQPKGGLPDADAMLAQKLLLETDPEQFRQISNVTIGGVVVAGRLAPPQRQQIAL